VKLGVSIQSEGRTTVSTLKQLVSSLSILVLCPVFTVYTIKVFFLWEVSPSFRARLEICKISF
jgi:hypothetical protein